MRHVTTSLVLATPISYTNTFAQVDLPGKNIYSRLSQTLQSSFTMEILHNLGFFKDKIHVQINEDY